MTDFLDLNDFWSENFLQKYSVEIQSPFNLTTVFLEWKLFTKVNITMLSLLIFFLNGVETTDL
jgi:hypothetical protein